MPDHKIAIKDFQRMFDLRAEKLPEQFISGIKRTDTAYRLASQFELEEYALNILKLMQDCPKARTNVESFQAWEKGGQENFKQLIQKNNTNGGIDNLVGNKEMFQVVDENQNQKT